MFLEMPRTERNSTKFVIGIPHFRPSKVKYKTSPKLRVLLPVTFIYI